MFHIIFFFYFYFYVSYYFFNLFIFIFFIFILFFYKGTFKSNTIVFGFVDKCVNTFCVECPTSALDLVKRCVNLNNKERINFIEITNIFERKIFFDTAIPDPSCEAYDFWLSNFGFVKTIFFFFNSFIFLFFYFFIFHFIFIFIFIFHFFIYYFIFIFIFIFIF